MQDLTTNRDRSCSQDSGKPACPAPGVTARRHEQHREAAWGRKLCRARGFLRATEFLPGVHGALRRSTKSTGKNSEQQEANVYASRTVNVFYSELIRRQRSTNLPVKRYLLITPTCCRLLAEGAEGGGPLQSNVSYRGFVRASRRQRKYPDSLCEMLKSCDVQAQLRVFTNSMQIPGISAKQKPIRVHHRNYRRPEKRHTDGNGTPRSSPPP